ncbi:phosphatidate cytidylyltransferase [Paenimyroides aestuarii]|uniref:Phosphatidate cytidylyltransferase n=1 Tax=Paenimyroides aestuarii TaxID=2968490 RepID=A0ABY5NPN9_9FLAO|nr:phosphatidate cytidylyltransferase [Paenimyroides aestuarii]UUV20505.1 phosphatidate cytidylyltransferase [Paenimyroides aestuarii]
MNEVVKRTLSGILYIALLVGAILFSKNTFIALFTFFYLIGVYEFCKLYKINKIVGCTLAIAWAITFILLNNTAYNALYLLVLPFSIYLIVDLFQRKTSSTKTTFVKYLHLSGYVIIPFIIITQLPYHLKNYTPLLLLSIFIMIWCNDTFAYICGKLLGKHKLFERISPKKTIEGFIGGLVFTQIAAYLLFLYTNMQLSLAFWMLIAVVVSFLGTIGDLIESKYKRLAGVKDSGNIMPGHGGILDRLDSILFAAPFLFLIYKIVM